MDALSVLLERLKKESRVSKHFLGLLHALIGRRITTADGQLVSSGLTWRDLAGRLKKIRWDPDVIDHLGIDVGELPPRDRERFWYQAIRLAQVDSPAAAADVKSLLTIFRELGYEIHASNRPE